MLRFVNLHFIWCISESMEKIMRSFVQVYYVLSIWCAFMHNCWLVFTTSFDILTDTLDKIMHSFSRVIKLKCFVLRFYWSSQNSLTLSVADWLFTPNFCWEIRHWRKSRDLEQTLQSYNLMKHTVCPIIYTA